MAAKTANVLARIEPDVKMQAEAILERLGVPTSVVINMLYKQIILTRSIPFALSLPNHPISLDEMSTTDFNKVLQQGFDDINAGQKHNVDDVFADINAELLKHGL